MPFLKRKLVAYARKRRPRDPFAQNIGQRIRQRRHALAMSQEKLHALTGISKGFLSDVEGGIMAPGAKNLLQLSLALGVSIDWIVKGES